MECAMLSMPRDPNGSGKAIPFAPYS